VRQHVGSRVLVYVIAVAATGVLLGCGDRGSKEYSDGSPYAAVGSRSGGGGLSAEGASRSSAERLTELGITGMPSGTQPQGLLVTGFVAPSEATPLAVIGVEEGDVIMTCNGQQQQLAVRLLAAIEGLQERGEPIVLVVMRDGEQLTLERTEKLPGSQVD